MKKLLFCSALALLTITGCGSSRRSISAQTIDMPRPQSPTPTEAQLSWQRLETYAFVHFGLNTYNDLEWGYGNTPASTFAPDTLDVEQWVRTFKSAGLKAVILTAKHHDGFCLWQTKTTEYSVKNSPWKGGKGDLVEELSRACHKHGLKFGLYLSPWDRNNAEYGKPEYQKIFHDQIRELTTGYGKLFEYWFDGANGGTGWYGGADETRQINPEEYYRYEEAAKILRANNPDIMIFGGTVPTIRWIGNESGWAGETNYSTYSRLNEKHHRENIWGHRDGVAWCPSEVDVSIRPGWFYHHREDHQVRSVANLTKIYYESVGRNSNLLLNFPVGLDGRIHPTDSANAVNWYKHIRESFKTNLLKSAQVTATNTRSDKHFAPSNLTDEQEDTFWASKDGKGTAEITIKLPRQRINTVLLQEYIRLGQNVDEFRLEIKTPEGVWQPISTRDSLTTIGYKRIIRMKPVIATDLRLSITKSRGQINLSEVQAFYAPELVEAPIIRRDASDRIIIQAISPDHRLRYRIKGSTWMEYSTPFTLSDSHTSIEAEASYEAQTAISTLELGYAPTSIRVETTDTTLSRNLLDGNGYTPAHLPYGNREVVFSFASPRPVRSIVYTPNQLRDAQGHIQRYQLYIDNTLVAHGELANIKANPIPVSIDLEKPIQAKSIRLVATRILDDAPQLTIGDISIF